MTCCTCITRVTSWYEHDGFLRQAFSYSQLQISAMIVATSMNGSVGKYPEISEAPFLVFYICAKTYEQETNSNCP